MATNPLFENAAKPTADEVSTIASMSDRVLRNLRITECYSRLSREMAARTGNCANWCTFATWASRQAGRTIRGEDLLDHIAARAGGWSLFHPVRSVWRALLRRGLLRPETRLGRLATAIHSPFDAVERASEVVAQGNLKVFEEIGRTFAIYLESCPDSCPPEAGPIQKFLEKLPPGPPPEGQDLLRRAFMHYQQQGFESDPAARAQHIVAANLQIGVHEQTRLQPEISRALESAPTTAADLARRALAVLFPRVGRFGRWPVGAVTWVMRMPAMRFHRFASAFTRSMITERLMVLHLPVRGELRLGQHLDQPFPPNLQNVTCSELQDLVARYEPERCTLDGCGAQDWADLDQRIHYISHLFRALYEQPYLHQPPFTESQVRQLRDGALPSGEL